MMSDDNVFSNNEINELYDEFLKSGDSSGDYPKSFDRDSVFKFFRHIIDMNDSSKIGNLENNELGVSKLTVRGYQDLAVYADAEGLDIVKDYCMRKGEIVLSTSLSRKGFLAQLFVTQIKKERKDSGSPQVKRGFLGIPKTVVEGGSE